MTSSYQPCILAGVPRAGRYLSFSTIPGSKPADIVLACSGDIMAVKGTRKAERSW